MRQNTSQRSRGYGFVTFVSAASANAALAYPTHVIDGRVANINLSSLGVRRRLRRRKGPLWHEQVRTLCVTTSGGGARKCFHPLGESSPK